MTDYNLLAKAEVEKYKHYVMGVGTIETKFAIEVAATAIQGIIDELDSDAKILTHSAAQKFLEGRITHYTTLKQAIQDYKL